MSANVLKAGTDFGECQQREEGHSRRRCSTRQPHSCSARRFARPWQCRAVGAPLCFLTVTKRETLRPSSGRDLELCGHESEGGGGQLLNEPQAPPSWASLVVNRQTEIDERHTTPQRLPTKGSGRTSYLSKAATFGGRNCHDDARPLQGQLF